ncbi:MAG: glycosyltransferase family 4 protein [Desulfobacterales bacterium]|nr:glycosyltransferase family 4 protein [Desulfobacterales bacterium]
MNILIVTQYFWPENFRINDLALGLKDRGHKIEVLTGIPNYPGGTLFHGYRFFNRIRDNFNGINIARVPLIPRGIGSRPRLALNFISFAVSANILGPILCKRGFDIIIAYEPSPITVGLPTLVLKLIKSAPVMFWMQDLWPESLSATGAVRSKRILKMVELMVRFIYRGCDRILIQSKAFLDPIKRLGGDPKRVLYFPNTAEKLYKPVTVEKNASERALLPIGFLVTFAGNIGAAQDFDTILTAAEYFKNHKDIKLVILGDGRMFQWVQDQVQMRDLQNTVHLLGRHPAEAMPRYFALSDALLVTLRKDPIFALTIPSYVQSYLACAKPIIAGLEGEGAKIIEESGAGITCSAENPKALSDAILKMYNMSKEDREVMGQKGRSYFEINFEREMLLDRLDGWMKELVLQQVR